MCSVLNDSGFYQPGDRLHTIFQKIWDSCKLVHKKTGQWRILPDSLSSHVCPSMKQLPLETESLPTLLMYHIACRDSDRTVCGSPVYHPTNLDELSIKVEELGRDTPPMEERMDLEDEPTQQEGDKKAFPISGNLNDGTYDSSSDNSILQMAYALTGTTDSQNMTKDSTRKRKLPTLVRHTQQEEDLLYLETRRNIDAQLIKIQAELPTLTTFTYCLEGREKIASLLSTHPALADLSGIVAKYRQGRYIPLSEAVKLDILRHYPLIESEHRGLVKDQTQLRIVAYRSHHDEVREDKWMEGEPLCNSCNIHHTPRGCCQSITFGMPALTAGHNGKIPLEQLDKFQAVFASFDENLQILGPRMDTQVLNLSPDVSKPPSHLFMETTATDYVSIDSPDYGYEYDMMSRLLILLHKLGKSDLPLLVVPHFSGTSYERKSQAQAAATAISHAQTLYPGIIVAICPVATYQSFSPLASYMDDKMIARTTGDCLTAQLASRGLAAITLDVAAMPLENDNTSWCVDPSWKLQEPLYTLDGRKRREFYKRLSTGLDRKLRMIIKAQVTAAMVEKMKARKTPWTHPEIHDAGIYLSSDY